MRSRPASALTCALALTLLVPAAAQAATAGQVIISEIAWMGSEASSSDEWLELYNNTDAEIDIGDWTIERDGSLHLTIPTGSKIAARGFFLIEDNEGATSVPGDYINSSLSLFNSGQQLVLRDAASNVIDTANGSGGWLAGFNNSGSTQDVSMERNQPSCGSVPDGTLAASWHDNDGITVNGTDDNGVPLVATPGAMNSGWTTSSIQISISNVATSPSNLIAWQFGTGINITASVSALDNCVPTTPTSVVVNHRLYGDTTWTPEAMTDDGGNQYSYLLSPAGPGICEYYISATAGGVTEPAMAPPSPDFAGFYDSGGLPLCIGLVRDVDQDGVITNNGERVMISGFVTTPNPVFVPSRTNEFFMQDNCEFNPAGVQINNGAGSTFDVAVGHNVVVLGTVGQFNGQTQIDPRALVTLSTGNAVVPTETTLAAILAEPELWEGRLVVIANATITGGTWPASGSANIDISDDGGTSTITLRIDSDTDVDGTPEPTSAFRLVGIVGQFDTSTPLTGGYQILPRSAADVNQKPVWDSIGAQTVAENSTLTFTVNATDARESDTLTYSQVSLPSGASFNATTREFSWTPGFDQAGAHQATLRVTDGHSNVDLTVDITVTNTNRAPMLSMIGDKTIAEDATLTFTVSATDPDGQGITYSATGLPAGAMLDPSSGAFSWKPAFDQAGTYPVTITASDGDLGASEMITITVTNTNRAPTLDAVGNKSVAEGSELAFTVTGSDPDGEMLTFTATGLPTGASLTLGGAFSWTPGYDQNGTYNVTITVSDGDLSASEAITITVTNTNRPPVLAAIGDKTVRETDTLSFTASATDPDGDTLTWSATGLPSGATLASATGAFSWTPGVDDAGSYSVTITVSDGSLSDSETFSISVTESNRAPVFDPIESKTVIEGDTLTFMVSATDPDGNSLTYSASGLPDGASFNPATRTFTWTTSAPGQSHVTSRVVTFTASDGTLSTSTSVNIFVIKPTDSGACSTTGSPLNGLPMALLILMAVIWIGRRRRA